jgi:hypothetical protein
LGITFRAFFVRETSRRCAALAAAGRALTPPRAARASAFAVSGLQSLHGVRERTEERACGGGTSAVAALCGMIGKHWRVLAACGLCSAKKGVGSTCGPRFHH